MWCCIARTNSVSLFRRSRKASKMLRIKNRWLVGLCLGFGFWAPSTGLAQQPIRIGATTALTGEAAIQGGYLREGYLFAKSM